MLLKHKKGAIGSPFWELVFTLSQWQLLIPLTLVLIIAPDKFGKSADRAWQNAVLAQRDRYPQIHMRSEVYVSAQERGK